MHYSSFDGWLEINPFGWSSILEFKFMKSLRMTTHVQGIARCMLCVDREPAVKDIKMIYILIKQARITNLEIRLQAECAINSRANYSWLNWSSVMSMWVKFHSQISIIRTLPQGKGCPWAEHRWRCWLVGIICIIIHIDRLKEPYCRKHLVWNRMEYWEFVSDLLFR